MKASEARKLADKVNVDLSSGQLSQIILLIQKEATEGGYSVWYYEKQITDKVRQTLSDMGYTVGRTQYERDEMLTKISW